MHTPPRRRLKTRTAFLPHINFYSNPFFEDQHIMTRKPPYGAATGAVASAAARPPPCDTRDEFVHLTPGGVKNQRFSSTSGLSHRGLAAAAAAAAPARCSLGPSAPMVKVRPRSGSSGGEILKPHTGMTIRLTPELLGRFRQPGPRPKIELVLKSADEGQLLACAVS